MITDGNGNVVIGKDSEGKSHISYKPYGEILRTDSGGPDISKFKFTGQEEDKESGLMYYKARYYDPVIGRFLQADSMAFPDRIMGMNRYMYTEGNPVKYGDRSGNKISTQQAYAIMGYLTAPQGSKEAGAIAGWMHGHKVNRREQRAENNARVQKGINAIGALTLLDKNTMILGGIIAGYRGYKYLTGADDRNKLDSKYKSAAIGYMANGEEGALAGFMYGTLKDKEKHYKRRVDRESDAVMGIAVVSGMFAFSGYGLPANASAEAVISGGLTQVMPSVSMGIFSESIKTKAIDYNLAVLTCSLSFYQHSMQTNEPKSVYLDGLCAAGIGETK
ncbi:MAG: RHS repeat-associated core domain-containing protein [Leptospiraceae bacterium]|nr:RHS repeat-associated core domain-containing protein [Leptospiraceae bacterium]